MPAAWLLCFLNGLAVHTGVSGHRRPFVLCASLGHGRALGPVEPAAPRRTGRPARLSAVETQVGLAQWRGCAPAKARCLGSPSLSSGWFHKDLVIPSRHVTQQSIPEEEPSLHFLVIEAMGLLSVFGG